MTVARRSDWSVVGALAGSIVLGALLYFLYVGAYTSAGLAVLCFTGIAVFSMALSAVEVDSA